jgi:hypothetical protein
VRAALAAGLTTVGLLVHVPRAERAARRSALLAAGAVLVVEDWDELADLLETQRHDEVRPHHDEGRARDVVRVPVPRRPARQQAAVEAV